MDHFALPEDDLSLARATRTLSRNFMGYTTKRAPDVVALGTSGISDVQGSYAQNHKRLASYYESVDRGELPVERGVALSDDDRIRRYVITELMCNSRVRVDDVEQRFSIDFVDYFATELDMMHEPDGAVTAELVTVADDALYATELGEIFIRNVAMSFDAYLLGGSARAGRTFSRTI
jgi:oxygen-independent coproporphyrinogen-3 oxidase